MAMKLKKRQLGMTLTELVVAAAIMSILAFMVIPIGRNVVKREKEKELRQALRDMREAIDRYKDLSDMGLIRVKLDSMGYPPDLDELVKGVDVNNKKIKFLKKIPLDPMTNSHDWALRSMQDEPGSGSWDGNSVYDVYTRSTGTAMDGTKYADW